MPIQLNKNFLMYNPLTYHRILFYLALSISFLAVAQQKKIHPQLEDVKFLMDEWTVSNYKFEENQWKSLGDTSSKVETVHEGRFVVEQVSYLVSTGELNMTIIIGYDYRRQQLKLCALDKQYGLMDVYVGKWQEDRLVFDNLNSDVPIALGEGKQLSFKLTYLDIGEDSFEHLVEGTYDRGKTWFPFSRSVYRRKG